MIKVVCIGAGYFTPFHLDAWNRLPQVALLGVCDLNLSKAQRLAKKYRVPYCYSDFQLMLKELKPDVVDIITPPNTHLSIFSTAAQLGIHVICQKPLAPSIEEAKKMIALAKEKRIRFMVHENFRFQPWYRQIKKMLDTGSIGDKLHQIYFRMRTGDGWPSDAYLNRQPYFRTMPRLLIYETGIHFVDTFRYLAGEIKSVSAKLRQLNPNITGEDCGLLLFEFEKGGIGIWDANRFNESNTDNPRYTFGEMLLEGNKGSIRLYHNGKITLQRLGQKEKDIPYLHENKNFAGDCVYFTQQHFTNAFLNDVPFETEGNEYLKNLELQELIYAKQDLIAPRSQSVKT
ncbi:MAG: Gfo/Idh/MocA family oxidoreductase [Bacteroidota bacterium]